jgi:hypothetical protein
MSVVAATQKQLAVLQGEVDGLACKLNGYERALQDCEFEVRSLHSLCSIAAIAATMVKHTWPPLLAAIALVLFGLQEA